MKAAKRIFLALTFIFILAQINALAQVVTAFKAGQLVVPENPLDNIRTLKKVGFVMKNGKVFKQVK